MREPLNQFADRIIRNGEVPEFIHGLVDKGVRPRYIVALLDQPPLESMAETHVATTQHVVEMFKESESAADRTMNYAGASMGTGVVPRSVQGQLIVEVRRFVPDWRDTKHKELVLAMSKYTTIYQRDERGNYGGAVNPLRKKLKRVTFEFE